MKSKELEQKLKEQQKEIEKLKKKIKSQEWTSMFLLWSK
jgi:ABC-type Fe3+-citrate transport system substrate-binding protein